MKKTFPVSVIVIFLAAALAAAAPKAVSFSVGYTDFFCGTALPVSLQVEPVVRPLHSGPVTVDVGISSFAFTPPDVTINAGDTVRWTNNGGGHTTTSNTAVWDSGFLSAGNMFSFTFNDPGMFPYICSIHPFMTANITVEGGSTPTETPSDTPTNTPSVTPTSTASSTATTTPTPLGTPSLGNYPDSSLVLSGNTTITPDAPPADTTSIIVQTSTGFVGGQLTADPVTGVVRVTNARHANLHLGTYTVTVRAFGPGGMATRTFLLTVTGGTTCNKEVVFTSPAVPEVPVGLGATSVAIGDFNNDGIQDLAAANNGSNNVSIRLGNGSGGFTSPAVPEVSVGVQPYSVTIGDLNGDGRQDFVAGNSGSNNVSIRLGDGTGGFTSPAVPEITVGNNPSFAAIGDFNSDGIPDLAIAYDGGVAIRLGTGNGGFTSPPNVPVYFPASIAIGDFNSDGMQDFAAANGNSSNYVSIRLGNGSGGFTSPAVPEVPVGYGPVWVAIGDFNNDGNQDFVTANGNQPPNLIYTVSIRLGNGNGGFTSPPVPEIAIVSASISVAIGDFNRDGKLDFAAANTDNNGKSVSIRLGDGSGGFTSPLIPEVPSAVAGFDRPNSVAIGDFNGDGMQDLAVANGFGSVSIRMGACSWIIGGTATYGNAAAPPKYISNATVTGTGSPNVFTTTGAPGPNAGQYLFYGFGEGSYTVSLSKTTGQNGISSNDAARVAQHVTGTLLLTNDIQKVTADVTGNNVIQSFDAAKIAQYVVGLPISPPNFTGTWRFYVPPGPTFPIGSSPTTRMYSPVSSTLTSEDWVGILGGEVTGNWVPGAARPAGRVESGKWKVESEVGGPERGIEVNLPEAASSTDKNIIIPVSVEGVADKGIISYEFDLRYDPSVIQPLAEPVDVAGTVSRGLSVVTNAAEPGLLRVVVYGAMPIDENGVLLNLRFTAVGAVGSVSPIVFERMMFNEGEPRITASDGQIELF